MKHATVKDLGTCLQGQTCDQQCFTISEVAADRHMLMIASHYAASIACSSEH